MKKIQMIAGLIPVMALLLASCSREYEAGGEKASPDDLVALTFNMTTPAGDKVIYKGTRAIHDAPEYAINSLTLYEYSVDDQGATSFVQAYTYDSSVTTGNTLDLQLVQDNLYSFTLKYPSTEIGKKLIYKFVANDKPTAPNVGDSFDPTFNTTEASIKLQHRDTADKLADAKTGIAMSGTAKDETGSEEITLSRYLKCEVKMTRIVARIDVENIAPNVMVTYMEVQKAAAKGYLFPGNSPMTPGATDADFTTVRLNSGIKLPTAAGPETWPKAFYLYERENKAGADGSADDTMIVYVEYKVIEESTGAQFQGSVEIPFRKPSPGDDEFVNTERNHLYKIKLGTETGVPTGGQLTFNIEVDEWDLVELEEEIEPQPKPGETTPEP